MGRLHELCSFSNFIEIKMDQMKLGKSFPAQENAEIGEGVSKACGNLEQHALALTPLEIWVGHSLPWIV